MSVKSLLTGPQREALELREQGLSQRKIAEELGVSRATIRQRLAAAERVAAMDPADAARLKGNGVGDLATVHSSWLHNDSTDDEGRRIKGDSVYLFYGKPPEEAQRRFDDMIEELVETARTHAPSYAAETEAAVGEHTLDSHLLVIDPADVHIGKLCVKSETGYTFNQEIAVERMKIGVARLVRKARSFGIHRVLFVIGNDILHADRWTNTTTAGTPQDTDGLWHEWFTTARRAYVAMIEELAHEFTVDLIYTPSNHDWQSGYYLAQTIQAWFHAHPNVNFTDYYASPIHRKYYVYSGGLIGLTHGDGAKETELPNLMQHEARAFWGDTSYAYWYTHHWHHKVRTRYGLKPSHVEKDKVGLTIVAPQSNTAGDDVEIEVVRSPSAPDGWHHRNGHINLQAVEVFLHDGSGAQVGRLTEWF